MRLSRNQRKQLLLESYPLHCNLLTNADCCVICNKMGVSHLIFVFMNTDSLTHWTHSPSVPVFNVSLLRPCRSSHQGVWEEGECEGSQGQNHVCPRHKGTVNSFIIVKMDSMCLCDFLSSFFLLYFSFSRFPGSQRLTAAVQVTDCTEKSCATWPLRPSVTYILSFAADAEWALQALLPWQEIARNNAPGSCTVAPPGGRYSSMLF